MSTSVLLTDGYKFSMAEAGWPLRTETFHWVHRKGGPAVLPFDVVAELKRILPEWTDPDGAFLAEHEYEMGAGFKAAIAQHEALVVRALPQGAWFLPQEPICSITGPSALVSWLEPLVLMWSYRVQVATEAALRPDGLRAQLATLTCEAQRALVRQTLDAMGVAAPALVVESDAYQARVRERALALVNIVGEPGRIFEVGLRAATCPEQHLLALEALRDVGVRRTSHVYGAKVLGLTPVGTMGHEHVQRYGSDDAAFRAMCERRPQRSSFLLDTFDTIESGIPRALELMKERGPRADSIRYDSGDKERQYRFACDRAEFLGVRPVHILEDGFDDVQTRRFEELRREVGYAPEEQVYGYGGYLVAQTSGTSLTRDRVAAVYKLSQTGARPTMKFGNEANSGKQSVPGRPVVFRRQTGQGPIGLVGQEGEAPPPGYAVLTGASAALSPRALVTTTPDVSVALSAETQTLVARLTAKKGRVA